MEAKIKSGTFLAESCGRSSVHIFFCNQRALAYNRLNVFADAFIGRTRLETIAFFVEINNPCKLAPVFPV